MIDLKKQLEIEKKMDKFFREMNGNTKDIILLSFITIMARMSGMMNTLGLIPEFVDSLNPVEKIAFNTVDQAMRKVMKIKKEVFEQ